MTSTTKVKVGNFYSYLKSHNKTVIDFNFGRHEDLSTRKSDIHGGRKASVISLFRVDRSSCLRPR